MIWLSKLPLYPRSRHVLRDLRNPYEMHRTLMSAFPDRIEGGAGSVRFRVEPFDKRSGETPIIVLVQSEKEPDWANLPSDYLTETATTKLLSGFNFQVGDRFRFRLRANPTKRLRRSSVGPDGQPIDPRWEGKRIGLRKEEDQIAWLARKGEASGFRILAVKVDPEHRDRSRKGNEIWITQTAALFEGVLEVISPKSFESAFRQGIGSAKGFGFGLLSIGAIH